MATREITGTEFESTITENDIVLVDFWAPWCGPCRQFAPVFEAMSERNADVVFAKVNTDEEQELSAAAQISSIPTLMAFRENILVFSQPGALPEAALEDLVKQIRDLDMDEVRSQIAAQESSQGDGCGCGGGGCGCGAKDNK